MGNKVNITKKLSIGPERIGLKKLDDALWAYRIAYKNPMGMSAYKMVYGKSCHLPLELEHKDY